MGILGYISKLIRDVIDTVKTIRKIGAVVKELTTAEQIEIKYVEFEQFQKDFNISQTRVPREMFEKFDGMVNDYIMEYDMPYAESVEEVRYMLKTDEIDLDEDYIEFLREHDT